jgi:hypothetical protein
MPYTHRPAAINGGTIAEKFEATVEKEPCNRITGRRSDRQPERLTPASPTSGSATGALVVVVVVVVIRVAGALVVGTAGTDRSDSGLTAPAVRDGTGEAVEGGTAEPARTVMDPAEVLGADSAEVTKAESGKVSVADPDAAEPDNAEPDNAEPDNAEPANTEPDNTGGAATASPP